MFINSLIMSTYAKFPSQQWDHAYDTYGAAAHTEGGQEADDHVLCGHGEDGERQGDTDHYSEYSVVAHALKCIGKGVT